MTDYLKDLIKGFLDVFYPTKCCSCDILTPNGDNICPGCYESLEYINLDKRCPFCGREKKACVCNTYVWRFCELLSVFNYEGTAKNIMLKFKINSKRSTAKFFANEIALYIRQGYKDIKFDEIFFVPISKQSYNKRGFNQSELIAKHISNIFKIKMNSSLMIKLKKIPQHKSKNRKERLYNSRYKYYCKGDLQDKTILLIDDISTTGATLDDCTRALLAAGADKVYCAVAMVTSFQKDKIKNKEK